MMKLSPGSTVSGHPRAKSVSKSKALKKSLSVSFSSVKSTFRKIEPNHPRVAHIVAAVTPIGKSPFRAPSPHAEIHAHTMKVCFDNDGSQR